MLLTSLTLQNFRCYATVSDIPMHRLTVFIGENDAGKTGILDALELLLTPKGPAETDYRLLDGGERAATITISGRFALEPHDTIPEDWRTPDGRGFCLTKTFQQGSTRCEVEGRGFADARFNSFERQSAAVQKELLDALGVEPASNGTQRVTQFAQAIADGRIAKVPARVQVVPTQLAEHLPRFECVASADYRDPDAMVQRALRAVVENCVRPTAEGGERRLLPELERVQGAIDEALNAQAEKIAEVLRRTHPRIVRVEVSPSLDFSRVMTGANLLVDLGDGLQPIGSFGEGTKKKLWMGLLDWERIVQQRPRLVSVLRAYDEPDVNLDYDAERKLFANVLDATRAPESHVQAVVCTHSMTLVDRAPAQSINLIHVDEAGNRAVEFIAGETDEDVKAFLATVGRSVGISNSAFFYERAFVVVEGPSEEAALPILYRALYDRALIEDGIVLVNLHTCSAWKAMLKLLQRHRADRTVMLLDTDCRLPESSGHVTAEALAEFGYPPEFMSNACFFVGSKEFEDAFASADIAAVLDANWPKEDGAPWTEEDVDAVRAGGSKFPDDLLRTVKHTCRRALRSSVDKPEFAERLARHCNVRTQIPETVQAMFRAARSRAGVQDSAIQGSADAVVGVETGAAVAGGATANGVGPTTQPDEEVTQEQPAGAAASAGG